MLLAGQLAVGVGLSIKSCCIVYRVYSSARQLRAVSSDRELFRDSSQPVETDAEDSIEDKTD